MTSKAQVRSFLVRELGLAARLPLSAGELGRRLEAIQVDPVNLLARNHELVLFNRLPGRRAGEADYYGADGFFEYIAGNRALLPIVDLPLFVPFMRQRERSLREEMERLAKPVAQVLREIETLGPLTSRQITCAERVSGYWDPAEQARTKQTTLALQYLWEAGRVTVVGRNGAENIYDLTERALPAGLWRQGEELGLPEAGRLLREKYYRAFRIFDAQHALFGWQRLSARERAAAVAEDEARGIIEPLPVEGARRDYWALAGTAAEILSGAPDGDEPQIRFIPPLDNLVWRRERLEDLFDFNYRWEIYTPAARRRGGPYTMPVLYGAELIGRLDAHLERNAAVLSVDRLAYEPGRKPSRRLKPAVEEELERLRVFCGAEKIERR